MNRNTLIRWKEAFLSVTHEPSLLTAGNSLPESEGCCIGSNEYEWLVAQVGQLSLYARGATWEQQLQLLDRALGETP